MGLLEFATACLLVAKLIGVAEIGWLVVFSPMLIGYPLLLLAAVTIVLVSHFILDK